MALETNASQPVRGQASNNVPIQRWWIYRGKASEGPFSSEQITRLLNSGKCLASTLCCLEGDTAWRPLTAWPALLNQANLHLSAPSNASATNRDAPFRSTTAQNALGLKFHRVMEMCQGFWTVDFKAEVFPITSAALSVLAKDTVFWLTLGLGVCPLLIGTLEDPNHQIVVFALLFAVIWGVIFKLFVARVPNGWTLPVCALLFTATIGSPVFLAICLWLVPLVYQGSNLLILLPAFLFQVGIPEELCKIAPVVAYMCWKGHKCDPIQILLIGIFSGLGFAAFENVIYFDKAWRVAPDLVAQFGTDPDTALDLGTKLAMTNALLRSMSLVFGHAVWSGIFAYLLANAVRLGRPMGVPFVVGAGLAGTLHGFYDWLCIVQPTMAALVSAFSYVLFYSYVTKLRDACGPSVSDDDLLREDT
ncbi:MAG: PrsW family glutamic-type intramembrane protease [Planctomycetota bacterium]|nr:PrsW family glutamic-type intramembrane protease [Planctomycetota bacterium]